MRLCQWLLAVAMGSCADSPTGGAGYRVSADTLIVDVPFGETRTVRFEVENEGCDAIAFRSTGSSCTCVNPETEQVTIPKSEKRSVGVVVHGRQPGRHEERIRFAVEGAAQAVCQIRIVASVGRGITVVPAEIATTLAYGGKPVQVALVVALRRKGDPREAIHVECECEGAEAATLPGIDVDVDDETIKRVVPIVVKSTMRGAGISSGSVVVRVTVAGEVMVFARPITVIRRAASRN